jgi:hypothetical protein
VRDVPQSRGALPHGGFHLVSIVGRVLGMRLRLCAGVGPRPRNLGKRKDKDKDEGDESEWNSEAILCKER